MDLSGYRTRGRSSHLMAATYGSAYDDPAAKRKRGRQPLSLGARALLLLLFLLAVWGAIRHASSKRAADVAGGAAGSGGKGSGGGKGAAGGAATDDDPERAAWKAELAAKLDKQAETRIERQMRITPAYRGPGKAETFPHMGNANRLLLASHGQLAWYRYDTHELQVLHEGQGVYFGAFPGRERDVLGMPSTLWVTSRPHDWHPATGQEWLLHLDLESGRELGRVQLDSRFTHDAVRRRDRVYVASTGDGAVLELSYPDMQQLRKLQLFTLQQHVNTLGPTPSGKLWAVLHNLGSSDLVQIDLESGKEEGRISGVGEKAHGLVFWDKSVLTLDSDRGTLVRVDLSTNETTQLWQAPESGKFLKGLCVVDDIAFFGISPAATAAQRADPTMSSELAAFDLKEGLLLWRRQLATKGLLNYVAAPHLSVESTTYSSNCRPLVTYRDKPSFDAALEASEEWQQRQERAAQAAQQQLVADQLKKAQQQQEAAAGAAEQGAAQVEQAAAQVEQAAAEQAQAQVQQAAAAAQAAQQQQQQQHIKVADAVAASEQQQQAQEAQETADAAVARRALSEAARLPASALDATRWSSGLPRLQLSGKAHGVAAGAQLQLLRADVAGLKEGLAALPEDDWGEAAQRGSNAWIAGRSGTLGRVKPGVDTIMLLFSSQDGSQVFRFPWYDRFQQWVEPLLLQALGAADLGNVMRLQLARMAPHSDIRSHIDTGGYASAGHRIHWVLQSSLDVGFYVCDLVAEDAAAGAGNTAGDGCLRLATEEGLAFELNNMLPHRVHNDGDQPRIHLMADVAESPRHQQKLQPGQVCQYVGARVACAGADLEGLAEGADAAEQ